MKRNLEISASIIYTTTSRNGNGISFCSTGRNDIADTGSGFLMK